MMGQVEYGMLLVVVSQVDDTQNKVVFESSWEENKQSTRLMRQFQAVELSMCVVSDDKRRNSKTTLCLDALCRSSPSDQRSLWPFRLNKVSNTKSPPIFFAEFLNWITVTALLQFSLTIMPFRKSCKDASLKALWQVSYSLSILFLQTQLLFCNYIFTSTPWIAIDIDCHFEAK